MSKDDDADMPEIAESRSSARAQRSQARASLIRAAQSKTLWDVIDGFALDGLVELRLGIDSPDPKERFNSARELVAAWTRMPPRPVAMPSTAQTKEQWEAQADAAEKDPAVREFLRRRGWSEPKQGKETN